MGKRVEEIAQIKQQILQEKPIAQIKDEILMHKKKLQRRKKSQLKQNLIDCPECLKKKEININEKVKSYASIPALYTHLKNVHHITTVPDELKPPKKSESKPLSGRPKIQRADSQVENRQNLVEIDDVEDKLRVLNYFENEQFVKLLHNLMFTDGYLCKNEEELEGESLSSDQIFDLFEELSQEFQFCKYYSDMINPSFMEILVYLSTLVKDVAFIFIFYAFYLETYDELLCLSIERKETDLRFEIVFQVIKQETASEILQAEFITYFSSLHHTLNQFLRNF